MPRLDPARFASAVTTAMQRRGLSQRHVADLARVSQATISDWLNGKSVPRESNARTLLHALDLHWEAVASSGDPAAPSSPVVYVPRDGAVGAGGGVEDEHDDDALEADPYPASELRRLTQTDVHALRSMVVVGDSMSGDLRPGDRVIYAPCSSIGDAGLYVVLLDGARLIKRVQRLGGGALELIPSNPAYHRERFEPIPDADTENTYRSALTGLTSTLNVVGKVVFYPKAA